VEEVDDQRLGGESQGLDELSRQRDKRLAVRRNQLVPGLRGITIGELAERAASPATDPPDAANVTQFLRGRGHTDQTIESVLLCLGLDPTPPSVETTAVGSLADSRSGRQRLRTLAQLEAMLLED
jgi:hypothetical protein